jgi:predicted small integral membrane protein
MDNYQKGNTNFLEGAGKETRSEYPEFNDLEIQVEEILAVLDLDTEIPDNLIESVMQKKEAVKIAASSGFDLSKYLQIAAVLVGGMFIGILLGKNADVNSFNKKQSRDNHALMELREKHHLSEDYTFGRL